MDSLQAIRQWISGGLSSDSLIRTQSRRAIAEIFASLKVDELLRFHETLRPCWETLKMEYDLRNKHIARLALTDDADRIYAGLLTFHRSGYIREVAMRILSREGSPVVIQFALIRLADWVAPIQALAEQTIRERLIPANAETFASHLGLIERLAKGSRFRPEHIEWIENFLKQPECAAALTRGLGHSVKAFQLALSNPAIAERDIVARGIENPSVVVRKWAFAMALDRFPDARNEWLRRAASDPYGPIRQIAFEGVDEGDREAFLLDRSSAIRHAAQVAQTKTVEFYRSHVRNAERKDLDIAILGLAETGSEEDSALISPFISHTSARVRRSVIRAANVLASAAQRDAWLPLIANDVTSVAREAAFHLLDRGESAELIWSQAKLNNSTRVRLAVLSHLSKAGKWAAVAIYLDAVCDADPTARARAADRILFWASQFNRSFERFSSLDGRIVWERFESALPYLDSRLAARLKFLLPKAADL